MSVLHPQHGERKDGSVGRTNARTHTRPHTHKHTHPHTHTPINNYAHKLLSTRSRGSHPLEERPWLPPPPLQHRKNHVEGRAPTDSQQPLPPPLLSPNKNAGSQSMTAAGRGADKIPLEETMAVTRVIFPLCQWDGALRGYRPRGPIALQPKRE